MTAISIDAGTTVVKAVGYGDDGTELAVGRRPAQVLRPHTGWSEQDMDQVWTAVTEAVREAAAALPQPPGLLTLTAQGDGAWPADEHGRPTGNAVLWNDGRAADLVTAWERDGVVDEAFRVCGSRLSTGMPNAILAWLREHQPERVNSARHVLTCGGWLFLGLTGQAAVDLSEASAPFLDIRRRTWSETLLESYGLDWARPLLPELRDDEHRVAELTAEAAAATGLPPGIPVVMAPYDICATAIGTGAVSSGRACSILGTTLATEVVTDSPEPGTGEAAGLTVPLGVPGQYLRAFPTMSGCDVLDWGAAMLGVGSAGELMDLAAGAGPDAAGVRFLPYLSPAGERAPFFDPAARGSFTGLSLEAGREDVARALVEGVTLAIRDCLAAAPGPLERLALCGGGTRSDFWTRLIADATGLPVTVPADTEVGARGAWLTGLVATGAEPDFATAAARHVRAAAGHEPDPRRAARFAERYASFVGLRELIRPAWTVGGRSPGTTSGAGA
jgi:erythritol kinase (D-erythritol 1-phosphate-forming)